MRLKNYEIGLLLQNPIRKVIIEMITNLDYLEIEKHISASLRGKLNIVTRDL